MSDDFETWESQYIDVVRSCLNFGVEKKDRTGVGTYDTWGQMIKIDLQKGFPLLTTKKVFFKGVVEELLWMLRGSTNVRDLQARGVTIWDEWATKEQCEKYGRPEGDLGPVYGHNWRNFGGLYGSPRKDGTDQIDAALQLLRYNRSSRRILVNAWDPAHVDDVALPPCHYSFQFSTREVDGKTYVDALFNMRSCDVFLGLPFNIASYATLTHIMARLTGYEPGMLVFSGASVHLYSNHVKPAIEQIMRPLRPAPQLEIVVPFEPGQLVCSMDEFIADLTHKDFKLVGYDPHPAIKADVAV
jgi:thymidylate synthase